MDFYPSQFAYLVVRKSGITPEPHPYSIACGYNLEGRIKFGIRKAGDHTRSLDALEKGDRISVYGPYGRFSERFLFERRNCVFIGAGIGITPFLGMWHVAAHSEDGGAPSKNASALPDALRRRHPELEQGWRPPLVHLFYICPTEEDACFDDDIKKEVILSHFQGLSCLEERGHRYELYLDAKRGRFSAAYMKEQVGADFVERNFFFCGPPGMGRALKAQLRELGVPADRFIAENFDLL
jgi:predicted ferric reductase